MRTRTLSLLALTALVAASICAPLRAQDLSFERILSGRTLDIAQDHEGYIWIATANGLVKYDGYEPR